MVVPFAMLLNLASVCNTEDPAVLWGFITRYAPDATPETAPILDKLVGYAIAYYRDFVKPNKSYRAPDEPGANGSGVTVDEIGKRHDFENLRDWFRALYEVLLGQSQGPRFGSFVALYGKGETIALISRVLAGESAAAE